MSSDTLTTRPSGHEAGHAVVVDGRRLTLEDVAAVARRDAPAVLSDDPDCRGAIDASRRLREELVDRGVPLYGITTGFGDSVRRQISPERAGELQEHLIAFMGAGSGQTAAVEAARAIVLSRANTLARGHSGVRAEVVEGLLALLNAGIVPVIPEEGSVGASGDLAPLSYVAAVLTGSRSVHYRGEVVPTRDALADADIAPLELEPKEGLALINGTAFMTGIAALAAVDARRLALLSDVCTALTTEVLTGINGPFQPFLHDVAKPFDGQIRSAGNVRALLEGSQLARAYEDVVEQVGAIDGEYREVDVQIQDKYSVRCAPHFTGVLWDALDWIERWLETEINSSNDNPLFDVDSGRVLSGGNFAGGHVALTADALKTAVASVADLMDRQLELVVDEKFNQGLTPNLIARFPAGHPQQGLNHGFKGMQLACSSLAADALSRCMPVTVFSRSTEAHNQDKVSMGATAARQARDVVALAEKVGVVHLLALCQAADLRGADGLGRTHAVYERVRRHVPFVETDRAMDVDIDAVLAMLRDDTLLEGLEGL